MLDTNYERWGETLKEAAPTKQPEEMQKESNSFGCSDKVLPDLDIRCPGELVDSVIFESTREIDVGKPVYGYKFNEPKSARFSSRAMQALTNNKKR